MIHKLSIGSVRLRVFDQGEGETILFVHGFPLEHRMWNFQLEEFSKTHRVIAPDLRGLGRSDATADIVTMEEYANDLATILDQLEIDEPVTFCGLSMGGYIGWKFWRKHADRLSRLIMCDTRAIADTEEAQATRLETAEKVMKEGSGILADGLAGNLFSEFTQEHYPERIEQCKQAVRDMSPMGLAAALRGMAARPDMSSSLSSIDIPTLIIVGEKDSISKPEEMQSIADQIPNSWFEVIAGAGHLSPLESPEKVNACIRDFLNSTSESA